MVAVGLLAALLAFAPAAEAANPKSKRAKRTFVYVLVVDGLDRDAVVGEGRAPFLSSLIDDGPGGHGVFYRNSRSVMVAETNPNHSSMITGAFPERHGIVGNAFATPGAGAERGFLPGLAGRAPRSRPPARARAAWRPRPSSPTSSGTTRTGASPPH